MSDNGSMLSKSKFSRQRAQNVSQTNPTGAPPQAFDGNDVPQNQINFFGGNSNSQLDSKSDFNDLDVKSMNSAMGGKALTEMDGADAFSNMQKGKKDKLKSEKKGKSKRHDKQIKIGADVDALDDDEDMDVDAAVKSAYDNASQSGWDKESR